MSLWLNVLGPRGTRLLKLLLMPFYNFITSNELFQEMSLRLELSLSLWTVVVMGKRLNMNPWLYCRRC